MLEVCPLCLQDIEDGKSKGLFGGAVCTKLVFCTVIDATRLALTCNYICYGCYYLHAMATSRSYFTGPAVAEGPLGEGESCLRRSFVGVVRMALVGWYRK